MENEKVINCINMVYSCSDMDISEYLFNYFFKFISRGSICEIEAIN